MNNMSVGESQIQYVNSFHDLVNTPFQGITNALCWNRQLQGDFTEIVEKLSGNEELLVIEPSTLLELDLSPEGILAREIILNDFMLLKNHGASPVLNLIKHYERDEINSILTTDVYSFHVDRSPIPTDTFLCTYHGASSELLPNTEVEQKVKVPEIRAALRKMYQGNDQGFESFLTENFYDLHYSAKPNAQPISCGIGNMWRLAVDHPESNVLPCVHRAPEEKYGVCRLLLIC